jgi:hypothetical protein
MSRIGLARLKRYKIPTLRTFQQGSHEIGGITVLRPSETGFQILNLYADDKVSTVDYNEKYNLKRLICMHDTYNAGSFASHDEVMGDLHLILKGIAIRTIARHYKGYFFLERDYIEAMDEYIKDVIKYYTIKE